MHTGTILNVSEVTKFALDFTILAISDHFNYFGWVRNRDFDTTPDVFDLCVFVVLDFTCLNDLR